MCYLTPEIHIYFNDVNTGYNFKESGEKRKQICLALFFPSAQGSGLV